MLRSERVKVGTLLEVSKIFGSIVNFSELKRWLRIRIDFGDHIIFAKFCVIKEYWLSNFQNREFDWLEYHLNQTGR